DRALLHARNADRHRSRAGPRGGTPAGRPGADHGPRLSAAPMGRAPRRDGGGTSARAAAPSDPDQPRHLRARPAGARPAGLSAAPSAPRRRPGRACLGRDRGAGAGRPPPRPAGRGAGRGGGRCALCPPALRPARDRAVERALDRKLPAGGGDAFGPGGRPARRDSRALPGASGGDRGRLSFRPGDGETARGAADPRLLTPGDPMWLVWRIVLFLAVIGAAGVFSFGPGMVERRMNPVAAHDPWPVTPAAAAMHA